MKIPIIGNFPLVGQKKEEIPARVRRQFNNTLSLTLLDLRWVVHCHLEAMQERIKQTRIPEMKKATEEGQKLEKMSLTTILDALTYELHQRGILKAKDKDEALKLAKAYDKKQFKMHV
jgi:hypothetical protein